MNRILVNILMMVVWAFVMPAMIVAAKDEPTLKVECRLDKDVMYEREPVRLTMTLVSDTPDIAFAEMTKEPALRNGSFDTFQLITPAGNAYTEKKGDKTLYCFPLKAYMITVPEKGKYEIDGGEYRIGVNVPGVRHDPFWGSYRYNEVKDVIVKAPKKTFNAKSLPNPPKNIEFSGSVGQFTIKTVIPRGDIIIGEDATAYIIVSGNGMIAESVLPSYKDAFSKGVKLKSVSESLDEGHDRKGGMKSELTLDCTFQVTDNDAAEIGRIRFDYFDPRTGKYESIYSEPVKIKAKSTATLRESISI